MIVTTSAGALRGTTDAGLVVFRGVPYAEPPTGPRRWQRPVPHSGWAGVRDATVYGPLAPQPGAGDRPMSEDCLTLNVWTPGIDAGGRPVIVSVHGGGLMTGSSSSRLTNGAALAARGDVVVVGIAYRLGALGTIYAPDRLGVDDDPGSNVALWDVREALAWVRQEIGAFGGEPGNVTAMGHSSGAVILQCLMASEAGRGLFDKAILQSGGTEQVRTAAQARRTGERFVEALDLRPGEDPRTVSVERILDAQRRAVALGPRVPPAAVTHPAIDGVVPARHPLKVAAEGKLHPVPVLLGSTFDEWRWMDHPLDATLDDEAVAERAAVLATPERAAAVIEIYRRGLAAAGRPTTAPWMASALVTDFHFCVTNMEYGLRHAASGNPVFHYVIDWPAPGGELGSCHGMCVPLVFGSLEVGAKLVGDPERARALSGAVQDSWISFARGGDPSNESVGAWPLYERAERASMILGGAAHLDHHHRAEMVAVWDGAYDAIDERVD